MAFNSKPGTHLFFNSFHTPFFDNFFKRITFLGDGLMGVYVILILVLIKYRYALIVGLSVLASSLIAQILKRFVFPGSPRPRKFFENVQDLYLVPGMDVHSFNSFPSGHSALSFALYFSLAMLVKNNWIKIGFFILALAVAFSRVYLSQHFFEDIYAGAIIGVMVSLIFYMLLEKSKKKWLDGSLVKTLKRS